MYLLGSLALLGLPTDLGNFLKVYFKCIYLYLFNFSWIEKIQPLYRTTPQRCPCVHPRSRGAHSLCRRLRSLLPAQETQQEQATFRRYQCPPNHQLHRVLLCNFRTLPLFRRDNHTVQQPLQDVRTCFYCTLPTSFTGAHHLESAWHPQMPPCISSALSNSGVSTIRLIQLLNLS